MPVIPEWAWQMSYQNPHTPVILKETICHRSYTSHSKAELSFVIHIWNRSANHTKMEPLIPVLCKTTYSGWYPNGSDVYIITQDWIVL